MNIYKKVLFVLSMFVFCIVWFAMPHSLAHAKTNEMFLYTIKKGDTLYTLSKRFDTSISALQGQNPDIVANNLQIGKQIKIQQSHHLFIYTVKSGDTLWKISQKYNSNVKTIAQKNLIKNPDIIFVNDILAIPKTDGNLIVSALANKVMNTLKTQNMQELSNFVHPNLGLRFSPYAYIDVNKDLVFDKETIKNFKNNNQKYVWGIFDGVGDPIQLTPMEYFKRFVYDQDFSAASQVSYNKIIGSGNTIENQFEIYPGSIIVEYYLSGIDPSYGGMDWRSLRLVFKNVDNNWYLIGIIHNEWTI